MQVCWPASADLENGFGDDPDTVAQTIELAAKADHLPGPHGGAFLKAAQELREHGTFTYAADAVPMPKINAIFKET
jgi:hypothetical protein